MNKLISTKNRVSMSFVGPSETKKSQPFYKWLEKDFFNHKLTKRTFLSTSQTVYDVMQGVIENSEFVQGVNIEFIDSLKTNGTKYLLILDDSCGEICNSKDFVGIAIAGRHRGLSTITISTTCFDKAHLDETLSSRRRTLLFSNLLVLGCKSVRLVHKWDSDQR